MIQMCFHSETTLTFYPIIIYANYEGKQLSSVEREYKYKKCLMLIKDAATDEVLSSPTGRSAKVIANNVIKDVADLHVWRMCRAEIMFQFLEQKESSYKPFRDALLDSGNSMLVEAIPLLKGY